jgi:hypothetical protein
MCCIYAIAYADVLSLTKVPRVMNVIQKRSDSDVVSFIRFLRNARGTSSGYFPVISRDRQEAIRRDFYKFDLFVQFTRKDIRGWRRHSRRTILCQSPVRFFPEIDKCAN